MVKQNLMMLADKLEPASVDARDLFAEAAEAVKTPGQADWAAFPGDGGPSTDAVMAMAEALLPGWSVSIHGPLSREHEHWACSFRQSDVYDNDPYMGVANGPHLPMALMSALLRAVCYNRAD